MQLLNEQVLKSFVKQIVASELGQYRPRAVSQRMFSRKDAAKYLGVSGNYIDRQVKKPTMPGDGKQRFYLREDLDKFAEEGKRYLKKVKLDEKA